MSIWSDILARTTGKAAMADRHPETTDREHLTAFRSDPAGWLAPMSYLSAISHFESYPWVYKAIKTLYDNLPTLPLRVMRGEDEVPNHLITQLLTNINDRLSSVDLWQQWVVDMMLGGEEGWEFALNSRGQPREIWPRQPHHFNVRVDAQRLRYRGVANYIIDDHLGDPYPLGTNEFIHFKFFNPRNVWRGLAPITAIRNSITLDVLAQAWGRLFFKNSARPDFAVIAPEGLVESERKEIYDKLMQEHSGENAHTPIILEQGISDIKTFSYPPKDMEWIEQRGMSREEIGAIFGVPDEIMGWGRDTYENFDTALRVLWVLTILPLDTFRCVSLTEYCQGQKWLRPDERIESDTTGVQALSEGETAEWAREKEKITAGVTTINQYRARRGQDPVPWGNVWWAPLNLVPITGVPSAAPSQPATAPAAPKSKTHVYGSAEHVRLIDAHLKRTDPWEKRFQQFVIDLFERQRADVLSRLERTHKQTPESIANNPFDQAAWDEIASREAQPFLREIMQAAGNAAFDDLGLSLVFDVDRPAIARFIRTRAQRFAREINPTTWEALRESLGAGLDAGESIPKLMARVEEVMAGRIQSSSETIARTETQGATSGGTLTAWRDTGIVESKEWISALIMGRSRQEHMDAHGQIVGLDEQFDIGGIMTDGPGLSGDAGTDINCLCTFAPVIKESAAHVPVERKNGHRQEAVHVYS